MIVDESLPVFIVSSIETMHKHLQIINFVVVVVSFHEKMMIVKVHDDKLEEALAHDIILKDFVKRVKLIPMVVVFFKGMNYNYYLPKGLAQKL